jgi:hypothetical protein
MTDPPVYGRPWWRPHTIDCRPSAFLERTFGGQPAESTVPAVPRRHLHHRSTVVAWRSDAEDERMRNAPQCRQE